MNEQSIALQFLTFGDKHGFLSSGASLRDESCLGNSFARFHDDIQCLGAELTRQTHPHGGAVSGWWRN